MYHGYESECYKLLIGTTVGMKMGAWSPYINMRLDTLLEEVDTQSIFVYAKDLSPDKTSIDFDPYSTFTGAVDFGILFDVSNKLSGSIEVGTTFSGKNSDGWKLKGQIRFDF